MIIKNLNQISTYSIYLNIIRIDVCLFFEILIICLLSIIYSFTSLVILGGKYLFLLPLKDGIQII